MPRSVGSASVPLCPALPHPCRRLEATRFPPEIISHAVWLYHRFALSHRDVEELFAERGIQVSYGAIRLWCRKFGPLLAGAHQLLATRPRDPKKLGPVELVEWLGNRVTITPQHLDDIPAAKRQVPGIFVVITVAAEPDAPMCDTVHYDIRGAHNAGPRPIFDPYELCESKDDHAHLRTIAEVERFA